MVGFSSSLRIARRSGWERAYLDYETLKLFLSQIESVYEHHFEEQRNKRRRGGGRRHHNKPKDYRDELFLESDSDLAFASSASDVFIRDEDGYEEAFYESSDDDEDEEDFYGVGGGGGGGGGDRGGDDENHHHQGSGQHHHHHHHHHPSHHEHGTATTNAFASKLINYSQDISSSGEDDDYEDDDDYYGDNLMSECAGGTISRAFSRRTNNSAIVSSSSTNNNNNNNNNAVNNSNNNNNTNQSGKGTKKQRPRNPKPSITKRSISGGSGAGASIGSNGPNQKRGATEFFVGNNFILEQSSDGEHHDLNMNYNNSRGRGDGYNLNHPQHHELQQERRYESVSSSLLNTFFQTNNNNNDTQKEQNEQTTLLPSTIVQPTLQERGGSGNGVGTGTDGEETMSSGFYNFPFSRDSKNMTPPREYYPSSSSQQFHHNHQQMLQQQQEQQQWLQSTIGTNVGAHRNSISDQISASSSSAISHHGTTTNNNRSLQPTTTTATTKLLSKSEIRKLKRRQAQRRRQRQERRRKLTKKKLMMEERVPQHLRIAHSKARSITERFRGLLKAEVEKVTLFAQSRLGELADTAGSLRFVALGEEGTDRGGGSGAHGGHGMGTMMDVRGVMAPAVSARREYDVLSDGGMHPSASSSDDENRQEGSSADGGMLGGGSFPWSDTSDDDTNSETKQRTSSQSRDLRKSYSDGAFIGSGEAMASGGASGTTSIPTTSTSHHQLFSWSSVNAGATDTAHDKNQKKRGERKGRPSRRRGRRTQEQSSHQRLRNEEKRNAAKRQILHFEELRQNRPIFQRNDHIVGEDLLLLSAVDEADGYTAVGVELMHILHYISVNVIAVRKICRKHDRLLANRMLGGYYHRQRQMKLATTKASGQTSVSHGDQSRLQVRGLSQNPITLGGIVSRHVDEDGSGQHVNSRLNSDEQVDKLEGFFDTKIQQLANSTTVQVISSCLALALSEYEVTSSRADALARLNSTKTARTSQIPLRSETENRTSPPRVGTFGLSPSRWVARDHEPDIKEEEEYISNERDQAMVHSDDEPESGPPSSASSVSLTRLRFTVVSISALREAARFRQNPLTNFLSRSFLVVTGSTHEGLEGCSRSTLDFFVRFNPDAALVLDSNSLYDGLLEGQWRNTSIRSVMLSALATTISAAQLPPSGSHNTKYHQALPEDDGEFVQTALSMSLEKGQLLETLQAPNLNEEDQASAYVQSKRISSTVLRLNCLSSLLYTMNYYIIFPTASAFAQSTGAHPAYCVTLIGAASFSAIFLASFHMYLLSNEYARKKWQQYVAISFFRYTLLLASFFPFLGNILYAFAVYRNSIALAVGGRLLIGLGSADIIHRQVITNCVPSVDIVPESARIVRSQFRGLAAGLWLGALLGTFDFDTALYIPSYGTSTIMAFLWLVNWIRLFVQFHEPNHHGRKIDESGQGYKDNSESHAGYLSSDSSDGPPVGTPESILYQSVSDTTNDELKATYGAMSGVHINTGEDAKGSIDHREIKSAPSKESRQRRRSQGWKAFLRRFLKLVTCNTALPVTLVLVLFSRVVHEILFASCAMMVERYFDWSGNMAGLFLGCLSATIVPVNSYCRNWSRLYEERTLIKRSLWIVCVGLCIMINWATLFFLSSHVDKLLSESQHPYAGGRHPYDWIFGVYQYVIGISITTVSIFALEGTALSLMSKVSPTQQDHSFTDCGTVVTIVGLFGRIAGDVAVLMVSLSHRLINTDIVNSLVILLLGTCIAVRYLVKKHFFFLI